jgi:hypothetical protein
MTGVGGEVSGGESLAQEPFGTSCSFALSLNPRAAKKKNPPFIPP